MTATNPSNQPWPVPGGFLHHLINVQRRQKVAHQCALASSLAPAPRQSHPIIRRWAERMDGELNDPACSLEDWEQVMHLTVLKRLNSYGEVGHGDRWLETVCRNVFIDHLRSRNARLAHGHRATIEVDLDALPMPNQRDAVSITIEREWVTSTLARVRGVRNVGHLVLEAAGYPDGWIEGKSVKQARNRAQRLAAAILRS